VVTNELLICLAQTVFARKFVNSYVSHIMTAAALSTHDLQTGLLEDISETTIASQIYLVLGNAHTNSEKLIMKL